MDALSMTQMVTSFTELTTMTERVEEKLISWIYEAKFSAP